MRGVIAAEPSAMLTADFTVLAPHFRGLTAEVADLVGMMPIGSANEALLAGLPPERPARSPALIAALFLCDPFLHGPRLFTQIKARGVGGVLALPSVNLVSPGVYRSALEAAGIDAAAELSALAEARKAGLTAIASVTSYDQAARAVDSGLTALMFHPGVPSGDAGIDLRLVQGVTVSIERITRMPKRPRIALYRHPGFGTALAPAAALVDDVIDWAITT
jgi:predicted TIM-barrel enzyme